MDSNIIRDLAIDAGLLHISPSDHSGRYYISQMASFSEVLLFARMIEREKEEELKKIKPIEVSG